MQTANETANETLFQYMDFIIHNDYSVRDFAKLWNYTTSKAYRIIQRFKNMDDSDKTIIEAKIKVWITDYLRTLKNKPLPINKADIPKRPTRKEKESRVFVYDEKDFEEIIRYLNEKTGRDYHKTTAHVKYIKDRLSEGYTLENFKSVIDIKVKEWLGTEMSKYLRPQTLFGGKFDAYLNQKFDKKKFVKGDKKLKTTWSENQNESEGS